nr:MAG TPA: coiled-coil domain-containing protein [Caudoviricetes sp.]
MKGKVRKLEEKLAESEKTIAELNADLDALVGGSDE